jgi:hypothetical protein
VVAAPRHFRVFRGAEGVAEALGPSVVAFGKFDGVPAATVPCSPGRFVCVAFEDAVAAGDEKGDIRGG